jgi:hypothetical protein
VGGVVALSPGVRDTRLAFCSDVVSPASVGASMLFVTAQL